MREILVELDDRRRVCLGKLGRSEHARYLAHDEPDGTIVLVPAVVMTEAEADLLANPHLTTQIEGTLDAPESLARRGRLAKF